MDGHKQTVYMEDGQSMDEHIATAFRATRLFPTPVILERERIAEHVAVREHRAFAAPGGAAGVEDRGQVIGLTRHRLVLVAVVRGPLQQAAGAVLAQCEHMLRPRLESDLADPAKVGRAANHDSRFGIADEILDLGALVGGVERQEHITSTQGRQVKHHRFDRFFDLHRHAAACGQVQRLQQIGHHGRGAVQVLPAVVQALVGFDRHRSQVGRKSSPQGRKQVLVGHGFKVTT